MPNQPPSNTNRPRKDSGLPDTQPSSQGGSRRVLCAKLGKELPPLPAPPFPTPLGQRIYESISQEAWEQWLQHSRIFINENGLRLSDGSARELWMEECERFLFGVDTAPPPGWVPPAGFVRLSKKEPTDGD